MHLYLVRHGEAKSEHEDPDRPLTSRGRDDVTRVARALARAGVRVAGIYHSGKVRARETAEILAAELRPSYGLEAMDALAPDDDPARARAMLEELAGPVMLVGHLPHLARLATLLLTGAAEPELVDFRAGEVVCLGEREDGGWRLEWALPPQLAG